MFFNRRTGLAGASIATALLIGTTIAAPEEAGKKIRIGVVYDYSGPLAGGGSDLHALGAKIMIDYFNRHGGVAGYQIEPIYADAQSKPEVAINEAVRLIEQEKVDILLGFFSSAQCVPVAARVDQVKKFYVDHHLYLFGCPREPSLEICLPTAAKRPPVRLGIDRLCRGILAGEVWQGAEGPARRHHP